MGDSEISPSTAQDIACCACGYNLKYLQSDGRCPECGTAIELSLRGDWLGNSDPDWINQLTWGSTVLMSGALFHFFGLCAAMLFRRTQPPLALGLFIPLAAMTTTAGIWILTQADPRTARNNERHLLRLLIRIAFSIGLIDAMVQFLFLPLQLSEHFELLSQIIELMAKTIGALGFAALFLYVRRLAKRIPSRGLQAMATYYMWGMPLGYFLWFSMTILRWNSQWMRQHASSRVMTKLADLWRIGGYYLLVLLLGYIVLTYLLKRGLRSQATLARAAPNRLAAATMLPNTNPAI
jgi:hypothetical protein